MDYGIRYFGKNQKKAEPQKLGDFSVNKTGKYIISINNDLNKYAFFNHPNTRNSTCFYLEKNTNERFLPHGKQWKTTFKEMMLNFLNTNIFPDDILRALSKHLMNPKASTVNDYKLSIILRKYDDVEVMTISDVPDGGAFYNPKWQRIYKIRKAQKAI